MVLAILVIAAILSPLLGPINYIVMLIFGESLGINQRVKMFTLIVFINSNKGKRIQI